MCARFHNSGKVKRCHLSAVVAPGTDRALKLGAVGPGARELGAREFAALVLAGLGAVPRPSLRWRAAPRIAVLRIAAPWIAVLRIAALRIAAP